MEVSKSQFAEKEERFFLKFQAKYERKSFGNWFICQVLKRSKPSMTRKVVAKCCRCNEFHLKEIATIANGASTQCKRCGNVTHGLRKTREYNTWRGMIERCCNPNSVGYSRYGGSGVTVCDRWRSSFELFLKDMGERPDGCSIDRINTYGNYHKENCRWATKELQEANKKRRLQVSHNGQVKLLTDWCKILNLSYEAARWKLHRSKNKNRDQSENGDQPENNS